MEKEKYHQIFQETSNPEEIIKLTKKLILEKENINKLNIYGMSPLHEACRFNYNFDPFPIINLFLENGSDITIKNNFELYPLDYIFLNKKIKDKISILELFLKFNKNSYSVLMFGKFLLHKNCYCQNYESRNKILEILLKYGADPNELNREKESPLCIIFKNGMNNRVNVESTEREPIFFKKI